MKIHPKSLSILLVAISLHLFITSHSKAQSEASIPWTKTTQLYSEAVEDTFKISIALPERYDQSKEYPVVFMTDPRFAFSSAVESARAHAIDGTIPPVILVGIGYPGSQGFGKIMQIRSRDFSTVSDPQVPGGWPSWANDIEWGGAQAFLSFIKDELTVYIRENYKTTDDHMYMGWSGGAHFGAYMLFEEPELFNKYLLVSGPFEWFHNGIAFEYEEAYAENNDDLNAKIVFAVGSSESKSTIEANERMATILGKRNYNGLEVSNHVFEEKKHYGVWPVAINYGLQKLLAKQD
ncbi:MAG: alpha/beta hydrolase [Gracilimonas sp.]|uniref:alpha/beta hydrolase n=1 Tax=Gracilimonas sp. TaxID=1974203 RepID=UPI0019A5A0B1|nr:alpha/beta hydrolase-fold protein [Gracilimonas sp.]MBD3615598.1 alpha/beta hydrolase [Gracilimonas sp.]